MEDYNLNTMVSNGKRFIAYELIKRLGLQGLFKILLQLKEGLTERDVQKDKNTKDLRIVLMQSLYTTVAFFYKR